MKRFDRGLHTLAFAVVLGWAALGASADDAHDAAQRPAAAPLDLHAPPINHVMPRSQIEQQVSSEVEVPADVTVERSHYTPQAPVGFLRAVPWALRHPLSAWRILMPVPAEQ